MLVPAKVHEAELQKEIAMVAMDPYYKLWQGSYADTAKEIDDNFWAKIHLVSVKDDKVIGYFYAHWCRPANYIDGLTCVHFGKNKNATKITFAADFRRFIKYLVEDLATPKLSWAVYRGNPVEKHYDRMIKKFGGRIMGIDKYANLIGGKWYDLKHYEWINDYHECTNCGHKVKKEQEVMCWKCGIGEMVYRNPFGAHV